MNSCFGPLPNGIIRMSSHSSKTVIKSEKLQIIHDLDLYFIRQIAHKLKEYDLEKKIDLEIKMREGTTKLLAACKHPMQSLEAAKSLLISNERMTVYMSELQNKKALAQKINEEIPLSIRTYPSKAKVSVTDIRIPLIWKDTDHFKNKGDHRRFSVFCLLKIGTEIHDTIMISTVDRSMTDITFDDVVIFNHVISGFEFKLEVYSYVLHDDLSIASTPRKIKKKISKSISRTIGKKLAANLKEELNSLDIGPKFDLVAHATLHLEDSSDDICTHDLVLEKLENPQHQLPLFGHFCCRLALQPDCITEDRLSSHLSVVQLAGNISGCRRYWCVLKNFHLSMWAKAEDTSVTTPCLTIPINKASILKTEMKTTRYPHVFYIVNETCGKTVEHALASDNDLDYAKWVSHITQHINDQEIWGHAAETPMNIPSPAPSRAPVFPRSRQGSLYEDIPYREESSQSSLSGSSSGILHESNNRISPPSLRSRSSSTSSASSSLSIDRQNFSRLYSGKRDLSFY